MRACVTHNVACLLATLIHTHIPATMDLTVRKAVSKCEDMGTCTGCSSTFSTATCMEVPVSLRGISDDGDGGSGSIFLCATISQTDTTRQEYRGQDKDDDNKPVCVCACVGAVRELLGYY